MRLVEGGVTTIYAIGLYEPGAQDQDPALLRKLAKISGGDAYFPTSPEQMSDVCTRIAEDIRQRYTVGYTPVGPAPGASASVSDLRQIRLHVKGPGNSKLIAKARSSYRYDEAQSLEEPKRTDQNPKK
jgi:Ca-activated chloride channel family protein